jgi:plasmid stability protein
MTNVQIKDVPEDTHRVLRRRAADAHQSLQEYLRSRLISEASQPTLDEALAQAAASAVDSFTTEEVRAALDTERAGR